MKILYFSRPCDLGVRRVQKIRAIFDVDTGLLNYWECPKQISLNIADEQTVFCSHL